jgi:hypothetical protein
MSPSAAKMDLPDIAPMSLLWYGSPKAVQFQNTSSIGNPRLGPSNHKNKRTPQQAKKMSLLVLLLFGQRNLRIKAEIEKQPF